MSALSGLNPPQRPVDPDWLALRETADSRARDSAASIILEPLLRHLRERQHAVEGSSAISGLRIVDLGAGTGANLRWLAPRLAELGGRAQLSGTELSEQRWTLVDHDPRLRAWGPAASTTVCADVADLRHLLTGMDGTDLITAAAMLDLLNRTQVHAVVAAAEMYRVPVLLSLSVTGSVLLDPPDPLDGALAAAFDAHQRRDGWLGPDAGYEVASRFRRLGWGVVEAQTPWWLSSQHAQQSDLIGAWIEGRAAAAVEWEPRLAGRTEAWLEQRCQQRTGGVLSAVVGHLDVLAIPPGPVT